MKQRLENRAKTMSLENMSTYLMILVLLCSSATMAGAGDQPTLSATLNRTTFSLDTHATLSITVNGSRSADIELPAVKNLVFHKRGQNSQMQIINGTYSSAITYNYLIEALAAGNYQIPAIDVKAGGHLLQTEPMFFEVTAKPGSGNGGQGSSRQQDQGEVSFVRVDGVKETAYIGEILPIEIKAYFQSGLRVEIHRLPSPGGEAFTMLPLDREPQQSTETINGRNYSVIAWQTAISPVKEGEYPLVLNLDATLLVPQKGTRSLFNDPFFDDDFFNSFFGGFQRKTVTLATPPQTTHILALPQEGKPHNFNGAIGEFEFEVSAEPTRVEVGDPITLTMKIKGRGNFDRVMAPPVPTDEAWKTYSPSSQFSNSSSMYEGEKIFEQAIVARETTVSAIPPLTFSYFDPFQNRYISRVSEPIPVNLAAGKPQPLETSENSINHSRTAVDHVPTPDHLPLAALRLHPGNFTAEIKPVYRKAWFLTVLGCSILALFVVGSLLFRKRYLANNHLLVEKKKIEKAVIGKLDELKGLVKRSDENQFLQRCREIIQIRLGALWQIAPSAITYIDLQKRLPANSPLLQIFAAAEEQAYGGGRLSVETLEEYYRLLEKELEDLQ